MLTGSLYLVELLSVIHREQRSVQVGSSEAWCESLASKSPGGRLVWVMERRWRKEAVGVVGAVDKASDSGWRTRRRAH